MKWLAKRIKERDEGFTLIELMIVIAIIAILAAVALTQYNAYKRKAKAKELVGFARSCAQEIVSQCEVNVGGVNATDLESCNYNGTYQVSDYLDNLNINITGDSSEPINCDNTVATITVTAFGKVMPDNVDYKAECVINGATHDIECKGIYKK